MNTYSFNYETLLEDISNDTAKIGKLKVCSGGQEVLTVKTADEDSLILKCQLGGECLGFLNSANELEMRIVQISHDEYVRNHANCYQLLMRGFFHSTSFDVALAVEISTDKDVYLVTDSFTGDMLVISTDAKTGEESDHNQYRDAKAMGLMD